MRWDAWRTMTSFLQCTEIQAQGMPRSKLGRHLEKGWEGLNSWAWYTAREYSRMWRKSLVPSLKLLYEKNGPYFRPTLYLGQSSSAPVAHMIHSRYLHRRLEALLPLSVREDPVVGLFPPPPAQTLEISHRAFVHYRACTRARPMSTIQLLTTNIHLIPSTSRFVSLLFSPARTIVNVATNIFPP
jgi:hypothetical protein